MDNEKICGTEGRLFFKRWLQEPKQLGTLAPISQSLATRAAALIRYPLGKKVVEIGAGTGRLTRALLAGGVLPENLTAVELDAQFYQFLKAVLPKINAIHGDASHLPDLLPSDLIGQVDYVFSVIPLMYLPQDQRDKIIEASFKVLRPGGKLYHVCYSPVSPFKGQSEIVSQRIVSKWLNLRPGFVWEFAHAA